jgi:hypothetical protein
LLVSNTSSDISEGALRLHDRRSGLDNAALIKKYIRRPL